MTTKQTSNTFMYFSQEVFSPWSFLKIPLFLCYVRVWNELNSPYDVKFQGATVVSIEKLLQIVRSPITSFEQI